MDPSKILYQSLVVGCQSAVVHRYNGFAFIDGMNRVSIVVWKSKINGLIQRFPDLSLVKIGTAASAVKHQLCSLAGSDGVQLGNQAIGAPQ